MELDGLDEVEADGVDGVQRRHRILEDHADARAAHAAHLALRQVEEIAPFEADLAAIEARRRRREEAEDGERRRALAAAGLADEGDDAALVHVERDAVEGAQHAAVGGERDGEIPDPEERRRHRTYASRRGPAPPVMPIEKADPMRSSPCTRSARP